MNEYDCLSTLAVGQSGRVTGMDAAEPMGRRLLDLGLIRGTLVTCVGKSPAGDPAAYLIRGAVIALRRGDAGRVYVKETERQDAPIIALAGNPNVGKSTVFNYLTGLRQHTGNWPGKTVVGARGRCEHGGRGYLLVDLPGTYSLMAHSAEELVARDFLCFGGGNGAVVVCDATCLERNLNLVLQTMELEPRTVLCVNLLDEARKKGIQVKLPALEKRLGIPVVGTVAGRGEGMGTLMDAVQQVLDGAPTPMQVPYLPAIEQALATLVPAVAAQLPGGLPPRWVALRLMEDDEVLLQSLADWLGRDLRQEEGVQAALQAALAQLAGGGLSRAVLRERMVSCLVLAAEDLCNEAVTFARENAQARDRRLDRILTSRATGIPVMLMLLSLVFWLTMQGANLPSQLLAEGLFWLQQQLTALCAALHTPAWLHGALVLGVYRTVAWVVSVMLPPMAIFFPLFTLLEDFGYLPRVAFVLDHAFQKAHACGKQALTMCMGFGCNAAGVVGCRIIDSPRERLIAIITNNFVPCNGRFPTLIAIITMFFLGTAAGIGRGLRSALLLTGVILLGVGMTFWVSRLLSATVLKGLPSSFALELPPYRAPRVGQVIVRSVLDRTLFVLGRAILVAAPAGLLIWLFANVQVGSSSILAHCTALLEPFARLLGLDGVILMAFILGFPANEIVLPLAMMGYLSTGSMADMGSLEGMQALLLANGWTPVTAGCTMLFSLMHWPCSTTCITIGKETGSAKWTLISLAVPTVMGMVVCCVVAAVGRLAGLG